MLPELHVVRHEQVIGIVASHDKSLGHFLTLSCVVVILFGQLDVETLFDRTVTDIDGVVYNITRFLGSTYGIAELVGCVTARNLEFITFVIQIRQIVL